MPFSSKESRDKYAKSAKARACRRRSDLKLKFGIDLAIYERMARSQGGLCAICNLPPTTGRFKTFNVDHDHRTGIVRGLLCSQCNLGIGHFGDDLRLLKRAVAYIEDRNV